MNGKFTYMDSNGFMHLSCPVCVNDDCEGHPGLVTVIPRDAARRIDEFLGHPETGSRRTRPEKRTDKC